VPNHPIETLMKTAMESIKEMVDVNTVVGDPVETPDGTVIVPISRVSCGFAAGGGEYDAHGDLPDGHLPFGGEAGPGYRFNPLVFWWLAKSGPLDAGRRQQYGRPAD